MTYLRHMIQYNVIFQEELIMYQVPCIRAHPLYRHDSDPRVCVCALHDTALPQTESLAVARCSGGLPKHEL